MNKIRRTAGNCPNCMWFFDAEDMAQRHVEAAHRDYFEFECPNCCGRVLVDVYQQPVFELRAMLRSDRIRGDDYPPANVWACSEGHSPPMEGKR